MFSYCPHRPGSASYTVHPILLVIGSPIECFALVRVFTAHTDMVAFLYIVEIAVAAKVMDAPRTDGGVGHVFTIVFPALIIKSVQRAGNGKLVGA